MLAKIGSARTAFLKQGLEAGDLEQERPIGILETDGRFGIKANLHNTTTKLSQSVAEHNLRLLAFGQIR